MLIEIRIGPGKRKLTESISRVSRLCGISPDKIHRAPHISLYGSFSADYKQIERVKDIMLSVGRRYHFLPYLIDGFRWIKGKQGRVIYFNIVPSETFQKFRQELAGRLLKVAPRTQAFDKDEDFLFHSTLAYKLDSPEFEKMWSCVSSKAPAADKFSVRSVEDDYRMRYFYLPLDALRVTFINDQSKIVCEYDFLQQRLLTRGEGLNLAEWGRTLGLYRQAKGIEGGKPDNGGPPYVISDLHLDHGNIIHYCARPFASSDIDEMNRVLVENWNATVNDSDVYFLGDLVYGRSSRSTGYWLDKLKGRIFFIRGKHDGYVPGAMEYAVIKQGRYNFLLVHDPDLLPLEWNGWVVHGHKHNNDIKNYPFINGDRKTINVCPELVGYRPVSLEFISSLKLNSIKRMDTIDSRPVMR